MPPLVAIGDSFTQGFKSLAITDAHLSYPALLARALGIQGEFSTPDFSREGGLPLNLEMLLRKSGKRLNLLTLLSIATGIGPVGQWIRRNKKYWQSRQARQELVHASPSLHNNLAVFGFSVLDGNRFMTAGYSNRMIEEKPPQPKDIGQFLKPSYSWYRVATRALNPGQGAGFSTQTQIELARTISETEPIEDLLFCLGANNILGAVMNIGKAPVFGTEADLGRLPEDRKVNAWHPDLFETQYRQAFENLKKIRFKRLYVGNVPRLSILPFLRGQTVSGKNEPDADGYFEYYYSCYFKDKDFAKNPARYDAFTRVQVKELDGIIAEYNRIIRDTVNDFNASGGDCKLVDLHTLLDGVAYRRNRSRQTYEFPANFYAAWKQVAALQGRIKPKPGAPGETIPIFDTRFFTFDQDSDNPEKRFEGGVFSLDGIHPTTTMAGVIAYWYLEAMGRQDLATVDWWKGIMQEDTLLTAPPRTLEKLMDTLGNLQTMHVFKLARDLLT